MAELIALVLFGVTFTLFGLYAAVKAADQAAENGRKPTNDLI
jgi:hypothetical protein